MRLVVALLILLCNNPCAGFVQSNLTQDAQVNILDLMFISDEWMTCGHWSDNRFVTSNADFNYDGIVNLKDINLFSNEWLIQEPNAPQGYSNQPVSVWAGGYGYSTAEGESVLFPGFTYGFVSDRFLTSGTLRKIRMRLYTDNGTNPILGTAKLKILSGFDNPFTVKADIDITEAVNLAKQSTDEYGRFSFEYDCLPDNLIATRSDFVAVYFPEHISCVRTTETSSPRDGQVLYNSGGDVTGSTITLDRELNGYSYIMDFRIDSQEFIIFDNNNPITSPSFIEVPCFVNEPQYIILEEVSVPLNENLKIDLLHTLEDGADEVLKTITIDHTVPNRLIDFDGFSSSVSCFFGGHYNIHIWTDPKHGRIDVLYYNKKFFNFQHISLTAREPQRIRPGSFIRRLNIYQDVGTHSMLGRIVVCRNPILTIGNSFVSWYENSSILSHVGEALTKNNVFSKLRYVINGGITGNKVLDSTSFSTAIKTRWNDPNQDLCAYRDVIVVFVNGPGLNDVSSINASTAPEQISQKAQELVQEITKMAGESWDDGDDVGGRNSVVLCEMIPYTKHQETDFQRYLNQNTCIEQVNLLLSEFAAQQNIPMAKVYDEIPQFYSDGTHPTPEGSLWIAQRIAQSYEEH